MNRSFVGVIVKGGQSKRMGHDKSTLTWEDKNILEHQIDLLKQVTSDIYLSVNTNQAKRLNRDIPFIIDEYKQKGPLGGIISCLMSLKKDLLIIPIDMPKISFNSLLELSKQSDNCCYQLKGQVQPFPSYWSYQSVDLLKKRMSDEKLSIREAIEELNFKTITTDRLSEFKNINSPKDLV